MPYSGVGVWTPEPSEGWMRVSRPPRIIELTVNALLNCRAVLGVRRMDGEAWDCGAVRGGERSQLTCPKKRHCPAQLRIPTDSNMPFG